MQGTGRRVEPPTNRCPRSRTRIDLRANPLVVTGVGGGLEPQPAVTRQARTVHGVLACAVLAAPVGWLSSQCAPMGLSNARWNDRRNDMSLSSRCLIGACGIPRHPGHKSYCLSATDSHSRARWLQSGFLQQSGHGMGVGSTDRDRYCGSHWRLFTWLAGDKARSQAERLGQRAEDLAERSE
jgi:hypothetical protein